jgi:hypothetical protein
LAAGLYRIEEKKDPQALPSNELQGLERDARQSVHDYVVARKRSYLEDRRLDVWITSDVKGNCETRVHRGGGLDLWAQALLESGRWLDGFSLEIAALANRLYVLIFDLQSDGCFTNYRTGSDDIKAERAIALLLHERHYMLTAPTGDRSIPEAWHHEEQSKYNYKVVWGGTKAKVRDGCLTD